MVKELDTSLRDQNTMFDGREPQSEDVEGNNNTNMVAAMRQHQHSAIYRLLHTPFFPFDIDALEYENGIIIDDENGKYMTTER